MRNDPCGSLSLIMEGHGARPGRPQRRVTSRATKTTITARLATMTAMRAMGTNMPPV